MEFGFESRHWVWRGMLDDGDWAWRSSIRRSFGVTGTREKIGMWRLDSGMKVLICHMVRRGRSSRGFCSRSILHGESSSTCLMSACVERACLMMLGKTLYLHMPGWLFTFSHSHPCVFGLARFKSRQGEVGDVHE